MAQPLAIFDGGQKFMWDGSVYETREDASSAQNKYLEDRFDVRLVEIEAGFVLYTRRSVTHAVAQVET